MAHASRRESNASARLLRRTQNRPETRTQSFSRARTANHGEQRCARARCRATTKVAREKDAPPSQQYNSIHDNGNNDEDNDDNDDEDDDNDDDDDGRTRTSIRRESLTKQLTYSLASAMTVAHARSSALLGSSALRLDIAGNPSI